MTAATRAGQWKWGCVTSKVCSFHLLCRNTSAWGPEQLVQCLRILWPPRVCESWATWSHSSHQTCKWKSPPAPASSLPWPSSLHSWARTNLSLCPHTYFLTLASSMSITRWLFPAATFRGNLLHSSSLWNNPFTPFPPLVFLCGSSNLLLNSFHLFEAQNETLCISNGWQKFRGSSAQNVTIALLPENK